MNYFLFKSLNIVNGYRRSLILDPQRNAFKYIPKDMSNLLSNDCFNVNQLAESYDKDVLEEYKAFLIQNEFIFPETLCCNSIEFTKSTTEVYTYDLISSSHFILKKHTCLVQFLSIVKNLREKFHCDHFSILKDSEISENTFLKGLKGLESVEPVYVRIGGRISLPLLKQIVELFDCFLEINNELILDNKDIDLLPSRVIHKKKHSNFTPIFKFDLSHYHLSLKYNSFFKKKIFFKSNLEFSSDNLFSKSYTNNILDITFKNSHSIKNKASILVCRDCEHKYICYDSRVPISTPIENIYTFKIECPYNPYLAKWDTEEGYQTVAQSIADGVVSEEYVYRSAGR